MRRIWTLTLSLEVEGEEQEIQFRAKMSDIDGRDHVVETMLVEAAKKAMKEVNKAHRLISVGEE